MLQELKTESTDYTRISIQKILLHVEFKIIILFYSTRSHPTRIDSPFLLEFDLPIHRWLNIEEGQPKQTTTIWVSGSKKRWKILQLATGVGDIKRLNLMTLVM